MDARRKQGRRARFAAGWLVLMAGTGCAHQERQIVRLGSGDTFDMAKIDLSRQSIVMELQEGQVVPLDIVVEGDFIASPPGASVPLTVKRSCFVRIDDRGLRLSADGRDFDAKVKVPGSFQLGAGLTPSGARATLRLTTPVR